VNHVYQYEGSNVCKDPLIAIHADLFTHWGEKKPESRSKLSLSYSLRKIINEPTSPIVYPTSSTDSYSTDKEVPCYVNRRSIKRKESKGIPVTGREGP
jgi:hypothetical protein